VLGPAAMVSAVRKIAWNCLQTVWRIEMHREERSSAACFYSKHCRRGVEPPQGSAFSNVTIFSAVHWPPPPTLGKAFACQTLKGGRCAPRVPKRELRGANGILRVS
jgi:hypothetical protein